MVLTVVTSSGGGVVTHVGVNVVSVRSWHALRLRSGQAKPVPVAGHSKLFGHGMETKKEQNCSRKLSTNAAGRRERTREGESK